MTRRVRRLVKRGGDVVGAVALLAVTAPLLAATALIVWAGLGRPIFFTQVRTGQHCRPFKLVKFRTMVEPSEGRESDAARLTPLGRRLRALSLDELPTLLNVLSGDMSLVGPRPLLHDYIEVYSEHERRRHEVPPGLTGLAQIMGRNALSWDERFLWDLRYVDNWSLRLDTEILLRTVPVVLARRGIDQPGGVTMSRFDTSRGATDA